MNKKTVLAQQIVSSLLFVAVIVLLGWLSLRYDFQLDWTANQRNTLTEGSRKQLEAMPGALRFIAFAYEGGEDRDLIRAAIARYQRFKPEIELELIDPSKQPQKVSEYGISFAGQVVAEYQGRREVLSSLSEPAITGALQRLTYGGEQWIVFLQGHGERALDGSAQQGYGQFVQVLRDKGLRVQGLNLLESPRVPDNTSVLVIASPQKALLDGEVRLIRDYVDHGGNLLWLADPETPPGLDALAQDLGLEWHNGFAVFPEYRLLGTGHPGIFAAVGYPPTPVTSELNQATLFPLVRSLTVSGSGGWRFRPFLTSSDAAWLETSQFDGDVTLDVDAGDVPGPLTIGALLTRAASSTDADADAADADAADAETADAAPAGEQRIAVVGDADFLSDAYLAQLGNQQLGVNLIQWLARRDAQIDIDVPPAPDLDLYLPDWALALIAVGFVVLLPLALLAVGVGRWALRRRR